MQADELTDEEALSRIGISEMAGKDISIAGAVSAVPWINDGITGEEQATLVILNDIAGEDPAVVHHVAVAPEIADGISEKELSAFTAALTPMWSALAGGSLRWRILNELA